MKILRSLSHPSDRTMVIVGVILGLSWDYIGIILGLYWGYIGAILDNTMETFRV